MSIQHYFIMGVILVGITFSAESSSISFNVKKPDCIKGVEKMPSSLGALPRLLKEGKLLEFYKEAKNAYEVEYPDLENKDSTQRYLWLHYYISIAPLLPFNDYDDNTKPNFFNDIDLNLKLHSLTRSLKIARNDLNKLTQDNQFDKKGVSELFSLCSALILHDIRKSFDPTVSKKKDVAKIKQKEEAKKRAEILFKSGTEEEKQASLWGGGDERRRTSNLSNKASLNEKRNVWIRWVVGEIEPDFLDTLVKLYPGKKAEVMKYIKLAGYENADAAALIDRTVGRDGQTEFLYKNRPKYPSKLGDGNK